jgi:hypothetical protein
MIGVARSLRTSCVFIRLWGSAVVAAEEAAGHVVMVGDGVEVLVGVDQAAAGPNDRAKPISECPLFRLQPRGMTECEPEEHRRIHD